MDLIKDESYDHLIEQINATVTEAVHNSRWILVEGYWSVGKLIREEIQLNKWSQNEAGRVLSDVAKDTNISERTIYRALSVYDKFPSLDKIPEGKNITWNKIITKYLPEDIKKKEYKNHCPKCGYEW